MAFSGINFFKYTHEFVWKKMKTLPKSIYLYKLRFLDNVFKTISSVRVLECIWILLGWYKIFSNAPIFPRICLNHFQGIMESCFDFFKDLNTTFNNIWTKIWNIFVKFCIIVSLYHVVGFGMAQPGLRLILWKTRRFMEDTWENIIRMFRTRLHGLFAVKLNCFVLQEITELGLIGLYKSVVLVMFVRTCTVV